MYTNAFQDEALNLLDGHYAGLLQSITDWRAGTVTEATYTSYARQAITFGAPTDDSPVWGRKRANTGALTYPANTGAAQDQRLAGIYSAVSGGTLKGIAGLSADPPIIASVVDTTGDEFVALAHGLIADQRVYVLAAPGAPLPAGISENTLYYVGTVSDANHLTLSTTAANANPVALTTLGACFIIAADVLTVGAGQAPEIVIGALVIAL
jgi:hypothetical protein